MNIYFAARSRQKTGALELRIGALVSDSSVKRLFVNS